MKAIASIFVFIFLVLSIAGFKAYAQEILVEPCKNESKIEVPKSYEGIKEKMEAFIATGVPGFVLGVESPNGFYYGSVGYAQLENQIPMETCHLQYLQSISKLYLAVTVLQLAESGQIDLDMGISNYLPSKLADWVLESDKMTVRMLLNHTSGISEYNYLPNYVSILLQDPEHEFEPEDYIELIKGKKPDFEPGSKYSYRNSGYVLLALMMDHMTGDHAAYMQEHVFDLLGLKNTFYRNDPDYLTYPNLVNGYWDRFSDGIIENSSRLQVENVSKLVGDDGIVVTPNDAIRFLKALINGELISEKSLSEMKNWVNNSQGEKAYGLGLDYAMIGGEVAFGHSGGGLGAGSQLYYFPEKDLYFFMAINLATVTDSPIHKEAEAVLNEIYEILLRD
ncbi:serine hydrolase [Algoriphagus sp.]|uniref:serine hydrolase domain-containing protein n=1 Tax=Algoriphagus sp. TaxID=1872435 RepID=UPI0025F00DDE|nr:serine hydrolase domain-containing protein [Algoriphagus sp.]